MQFLTKGLFPAALGPALAIASMLLLMWPHPAIAACRLSKIVEMPVTMVGTQPLLTAKINGADARFLIDTGNTYSMLSPANAAEFQLRLVPAPWNLRVRGVNGLVDTSVATIKTFTLAGYDIHNVEFLVGGAEAGAGTSGNLGRNLLLRKDDEFDLANGVMRFMDAQGCKHDLLAYWLARGQSYSALDMEWGDGAMPPFAGRAYLNGQKIRVVFDSGASNSILTLKAAGRAGIKVDSPGVVDAGYVTGVGRNSLKSYLAIFPSFKIGDEEIRNSRLRFADFDLDTDMLLGADFFLSHRIYIANSQHKLYFTYNGGPVFNLSRSLKVAATSQPPASQDPQASTASVASPPSADPGTAPPSADEPADAAALARRGAAFAGRRDVEHALADLTRACELEPSNPEYLFQRGVVHWQSGHLDLAMTDFNHVIELRPDHVPALVDRAELRIAGKDLPGAKADLDAVGRVAAKQADVRFQLANLYERADSPGSALAQWNLWIAAHKVDAKLPSALTDRCWVRALQGEGLSDALSDCNDAIRFAPKDSPLSARALSGRGLVRLRKGDYDKSIADYDASLKITPNAAWPLYGRGVAKIRKNRTAEGNTDIAAAEKIAPKIAEQFARRGISP